MTMLSEWVGVMKIKHSPIFRLFTFENWCLGKAIRRIKKHLADGVDRKKIPVPHSNGDVWMAGGDENTAMMQPTLTFHPGDESLIDFRTCSFSKCITFMI